MDAAMPIMSADTAQPLSRGTGPSKGEEKFAGVFAGECKKQGDHDIPEEELCQVCQMPWMQFPIIAGTNEQAAALAALIVPQGQALNIPAETDPAQGKTPLVGAAPAEAEVSASEGMPIVSAGTQAAGGPVSQANAADGLSNIQTTAGETAPSPERTTGAAQGQTPNTTADESLQAAAGQTAQAQETAARPQAVPAASQTAEAIRSADAGKQSGEAITEAQAETHTDAQNTGAAAEGSALKQEIDAINRTVQPASRTSDLGVPLKEHFKAEPMEAEAADASLAMDGSPASMEQAADVQKTGTAPIEAVDNAQRVWEAIESAGLKDGERLTVKLKPEMLGGLTIEAVKTARGTEIHIVADTVQGLRAMEQEMSTLTEHMQGTADFAGMQLSCRQDGGFTQEHVPFIRGTGPLMQMQEVTDMTGSTINHSGVLNILA